MPFLFSRLRWKLACTTSCVIVRLVRIFGLLLCVLGAQAATLEYLSTDDMILQSTSIVRGRVTGTSAAVHGPLIYTHYSVQVQERFKGAEAVTLDVVVPGGSFQGRRQTFSGTPALSIGSEYLLFLWTGSSGLTHVIGLSQGVFTLTRESDGELTASRRAAAELMIDPKTGNAISDRPGRILLAQLRSRVAALARQGGSSR
jgi:hypothetical protein